ncbi:hypothetical protein GLOIN_2v1791196 [Rhizophagus irregularis DAOM 181602=DAOM 197198]|nr:hypothetical protein GLOIN_2v1791196 [Rhizophagus irregularis DAOM 181602=DAOM 197198]
MNFITDYSQIESNRKEKLLLKKKESIMIKLQKKENLLERQIKLRRETAEAVAIELKNQQLKMSLGETTCRLLQDSKLSEITEQTGDSCGGSYINQKFLSCKLSESTINLLKKNNYSQLQYMV